MSTSPDGHVINVSFTANVKRFTTTPLSISLSWWRSGLYYDTTGSQDPPTWWILPQGTLVLGMRLTLRSTRLALQVLVTAVQDNVSCYSRGLFPSAFTQILIPLFQLNFKRFIIYCSALILE